jgi:hypothetical protein
MIIRLMAVLLICLLVAVGSLSIELNQYKVELSGYQSRDRGCDDLGQFLMPDWCYGTGVYAR